MLTETDPRVSARVTSGIEQVRNNRRIYTDIRALDRALVSEDLTAARAAFNQLQEDSPLIAGAVSHDPFPVKARRPLRALQTLERCLASGDLPGARQAFDSFS
jgi:hypothetical protein